ncbi:hypothetical protein DF185_07865 [Marinifilum breve]|uniref:Uncharacterized protein n=1 Tax=Marinifilum breve TaxID=2184082 RepID=A0A2V3ZYP1_9BACT|nr:hypothetical protein [Marinifilum breve]PXY01391.1 hypothetical protein DF185_07865 [Marinifilum breve]
MNWAMIAAIGSIIVGVITFYNWIVIKPLKREKEQNKEKFEAMDKRIEKVESDTDKLRAELLKRIDKIDEKSESRHKELTTLIFSLASKKE